MKIEDIIQTEKPTLLLQVCCAPCFCGSIDYLTEHFDVTAFFYNPDIQPKLNMTAEEYHKSNSTTINHFHEKLFNLKDMMSTDTAKAIAKGRDEYMKAFVDTFMAEWDGKQ